jgi:hypothetical protein
MFPGPRLNEVGKLATGGMSATNMNAMGGLVEGFEDPAKRQQLAEANKYVRDTTNSVGAYRRAEVEKGPGAGMEAISTRSQIPMNEWEKGAAYRVGKQGSGTIAEDGFAEIFSPYGTGTNRPSADAAPVVNPTALADQEAARRAAATPPVVPTVPAAPLIAPTATAQITPQRASQTSGKVMKGAPRGQVQKLPVTQAVNNAGAQVTQALQPSFDQANAGLSGVFEPMNAGGEAMAAPINQAGEAVAEIPAPAVRWFNDLMASLFTVSPENQQALADSMDYTKAKPSRGIVLK